MGTRNLTILVIDGEYKLAKYCQWDGYPSGQGADVHRFITEHLTIDLTEAGRKATMDEFKSKVRLLREISLEELEKIEAQFYDPGEKFMSRAQSKAFGKEYPQFHRDMGADILFLIDSKPPGLQVKNSLSFAAESLFCEWAYLIDLDKEVLEVYRGFNHDPLTEEDRFHFLSGDDEYSPIKMVHSWPLAEMPSLKEFCDTLETARG